MEIKPCPFCGKEPNIEDQDTLYPSGYAWIFDEESGCNVYVKQWFAPEENWCYNFNCPITSGGCGASMIADSKLEAIQKWNTRTN